MSRSPLHEAARAYAEAGIPVFPCLPLAKTPACDGGFHAATIDLDQIDSWWTAEPNYNIGLCPETAGWCVIDEEHGAVSLPDLPLTYTVKTPGGGRHLYFNGSLPSTVRKLGDKIDTRGVGGYVLVPPSYVVEREKGYEGAYEVADDREFAAVPLAIAARLATTSQRVESAVADLDDAGNITRATHFLRNLASRGDVAVSERGGNNRTYQVACDILNLGLTAQSALGLLLDHWNPACVPPWSEEELATIVDHAATYAQNEPGAYGAAPASEVFAHVEAPADPPAKRSKFYLEDEAEQEAGRDPSWIIDQLLPEYSTVLLIGRSGAYKSFLALDWLLSVATGTKVLGATPKSGPVVYAALEGRANIKKARRRAWKIGHEVETANDFYVCRAPLIGVPGEMEEFCAQMEARLGNRRPRLIAFDTVAKMLAGLDENKAGDASRLTAFTEGLVDRYGCTVLALHHTGKDEGRGSRGSSAFEAGFDTVIEVKAHRATKSVELRVRKQKDAEERETPWTMQGRTLAGSLVFYETTPEEHGRATNADDNLAPAKVGAALRSIGALGRDAGVTTHVLAVTLKPRAENQDEASWALEVGAIEHRLRRAARGNLAGYCEGAARTLTWFLP